VYLVETDGHVNLAEVTADLLAATFTAILPISTNPSGAAAGHGRPPHAWAYGR